MERGSVTLFDSAADYARYRPGIPDEAVRLLTESLDGIDRPTLLDLGSGTGQVPAALLPAVPGITRVDLVAPDSDMHHTAAEQLRPLHGQATVAFHAVPAETFSAPVGGYQADLVTCARAFHWLDRPAALRMADQVTSPTAAVAVMGDGSLWTYEAHWYRGPEGANPTSVTGGGPARAPADQPHRPPQRSAPPHRESGTRRPPDAATGPSTCPSPERPHLANTESPSAHRRGLMNDRGSRTYRSRYWPG
ncbi:methyltransferase domain-containing protein [Streptomyces sp. NBC_00825]|uniref:class I SAM-dependent methyltransferase n=1 Tax=unclassified Streptomyces TaxID=2593676 RepID=UPI002ED5A36D|nr:methyltransferase domain-containing protein [Streptomyces sp. NBC_00826]WTH89071.1 methyltransferase domain-containing protein [Streptomyces sp. NBC_00825]WTH97799.1 methyltransferase domain-containing protein [Streptomyces sp. NBC_00822]